MVGRPMAAHEAVAHGMALHCGRDTSVPAHVAAGHDRSDFAAIFRTCALCRTAFRLAALGAARGPGTAYPYGRNATASERAMGGECAKRATHAVGHGRRLNADEDLW